MLTAAFSISDRLASPSNPYAMFSSTEQLKRIGSWLTMLIWNETNRDKKHSRFGFSQMCINMIYSRNRIFYLFVKVLMRYFHQRNSIKQDLSLDRIIESLYQIGYGRLHIANTKYERHKTLNGPREKLLSLRVPIRFIQSKPNCRYIDKIAQKD